MDEVWFLTAAAVVLVGIKIVASSCRLLCVIVVVVVSSRSQEKTVFRIPAQDYRAGRALACEHDTGQLQH